MTTAPTLAGAAERAAVDAQVSPRGAAVVWAARVAIGVVFLAAALGKIGDPAAMALAVHNFRLAPVWSENLIAILLPWVELVAGLALVTGFRARAGAAIVLALMVLFTFAVGAAWARGLDFECGCFGKAVASHVGARKFFENVGLTLVAAIATAPRGGRAPRAV